MSFLTIFLTGLIAGGLTCLAVQGGLLATMVAQTEEEKLGALPLLYFLGAKIVAYTILGLLFGLLGSAFQVSIQTQALMQIAVAVFMIGTALNLLQVHPIFRYFVIQPPRFLTRLVHDSARSKSVFAPVVLGGFTIFVPCGTTQAMLALAVASGSPLVGALIMFAFVLGTSPLFFILGYLATRLGEVMQRKFLRLAAAIIIGLAVFNLNNALALSGLSYAVGNSLHEAFCTVAFCTQSPVLLESATQTATINIGPGGYSPNEVTVKAGTAVKLTLVNNGGGGCAAAFTIPSLGIRKVVQVGTTEIINFTAPTTAGPLPFMCSMGMYRGMINVI
ncbi:sulfite exporter TauE/SafE family protein [Candidatus Microgenomates bacterium]|nr:sulfite exporter TauE/SafE family protein [Candidatus Microgenomates bacterium]